MGWEDYQKLTIGSLGWLLVSYRCSRNHENLEELCKLRGITSNCKLQMLYKTKLVYTVTH